jgi:hypothetical protein
MAKTHPGVEILATAIDNLKRGDHLRFYRGALPYVVMSLLLIWLTAAAFYRNIERDRFDRLFGMSQLLLLAVSYIGVSFADTYIDLSAPVTLAVFYFSIAKIYALATDRAMQSVLAMEVPSGVAGTRGVVMAVLFETAEPLGDTMLKHLRRAVEDEASLPCSVETLKGTQAGIWGLFGDMLAVIWSLPPGEAQAISQIRVEAQRLIERLPAILLLQGVPAHIQFRHVVHDGTFNSEHDAAPQWRILFAQAILRLEQLETKE